MPIPSHFASKGRFVQVKDRIPFWSIAPNDKVIMVRGDTDLKGKEGIVSRVDRMSNKVFLSESDFAVSTSLYPFRCSSFRLEGPWTPS